MLRSSLFQSGEEMLLGSSSLVKGNTAAYGETNAPALFINEATASRTPGVVTRELSDAYLHKHKGCVSTLKMQNPAWAQVLLCLPFHKHSVC